MTPFSSSSSNASDTSSGSSMTNNVRDAMNGIKSTDSPTSMGSITRYTSAQCTVCGDSFRQALTWMRDPRTVLHSHPSVTGLDKKPDVDCIGCRVVGLVTGLGIAGYALYERSRVAVPTSPEGLALPVSDREKLKAVFDEARRGAMRHRMVLGVLAGVAAGAGIYRAFMYDMPAKTSTRY